MPRAKILLLALCGTLCLCAAEKSGAPKPKPKDDPLSSTRIYMYPRAVETWLDVQVALARQAISSGPIDGVPGAQTAAALRAFQEREGLRQNGQLDKATRATLILVAPLFTKTTVTAEDLATLQPVSPTWLGKSQQSALAYETVLEMIAERTHTHPDLIKRLNPSVDWQAVPAGTVLTVPDVQRAEPLGTATRLQIFLGARVLQARDETGRLVAHFPVSIARIAEKRPEGELHVQVVITHPDYTFDPAVYQESAEARELGRKLVLPPGPNNPVGLAWIGLDRPGYGIHGTPTPEHVGRTGSHGCFRLANWDALTLLELAFTGMPVSIEP